jgi:two-component system, OmpR family, sensor histidine kinase CpxA
MMILMRGLFLKIFLWFWLSLALVVVALVFGVLATRSGEIAGPPWFGLINSAVRTHALNAAAAFEQGGRRALDAYLAEINRTARVEGYLFDAHGLEIDGSVAADEIKELASRTASSKEVAYRFRAPLPMAAERVVTARGDPYVFVVKLTSAPGFGADRRTLWLRIALVLLTAGIVCYGFARYLVAPVARLRHATQRLAEGDLSARAGAATGRRRDELVDLGRDFDRMAERIESLILAQRRLLGDISHELRSPLARLRVALELARKRCGGDVGGALEIIEDEAQQLDKLIGQLLTLTRFESGDHAKVREIVDLTLLVEEVGRDADFEAQGSNRAVRVVECDKCRTPGSTGLLRSAIENVVRNAVYYTAENTTVEISLRRAPNDEGAQAIISVRDHGAGVAEEELERIFQPFYRAGEARDRQTGGTGLGLAITERAMRLHHGSVTARNMADGGLIVELRLPLHLNHQKDTPPKTLTVNHKG